MEKPWDKLRAVPEQKKPPIRPGVWSTSGVVGGTLSPIAVELRELTRITAVLTIGCPNKNMPKFAMYPEEMRLLSEFLSELADQLEGK